MNPQGWNRYSYVGNDPLAFTDPNGFSWLSSFFNSVVNFFRNNPIVRAVVQIAITVALAWALGPIVAGQALTAFTSAAAGSAITTALSGGNLGQVLRAGAVAGATAVAFLGIGDATNAVAGYSGPGHIQPAFGSSEHAVNVAGHALVGCGSSVASGGSCGSGALAAGISAGTGPMMGGMDLTRRLVANTVLGGVGSVAGGGKFANGAITGAFGYLFNSRAGRIAGGIVGGIIGAALTGPEDVPLTWAGYHLGAALGDWITGPDASVVGTESQWGQKFGQHGSEFGFSMDRSGLDAYKSLANDVRNDLNAKVTQYPSDAPMYRGETHYEAGGNLLRIDPDGKFRSLYPLR